ncbi:hypothetical protein Syun_012355 [Stephania yunnanensis]|uniref:Uncharacterized protein n=1 Tax=Stephania yunnanensis TaxID=152371 RepID=A0AAP0K0A8_9MAGN
MERPAKDYEGLYREESELAFMGAILCNEMTTLRNQDLIFEKQRDFARSIHGMEQLEYHRYDITISCQSQRIDPVEDDDDVTIER